MRNQPFSDLTADWVETGGRSDPSRRRPYLLALIILCFQIPIVVRLIQLQCVISDRFVQPWQVPNVEVEAIPARDGRILSRDGVVLAQDVVQYDIAVDYRWLQSPLDEVWLRRQVQRELTREQRKDARLRETVETRLRSHRDQLLQRLSGVTGRSEQEIVENMADIQRRIEAMKIAVERRRHERNDANDSQFDWSQGLTGISRLVVDELTRPPDRFIDDPVILKEELQPHTVIRDVSLQVAATIQSLPEHFRGVTIRPNSTRSYPRETLASHVVGVRRQAGNETSGAQPRIGESGLELSQQDRLQGVPGEQKQVRDRHGDLIESEQIRAPRDGEDIVLTIDSRLQQLAEQLLDQVLYPPPKSVSSDIPIPRGACLLAMDVWTGDLLTLATSPRIPLNVLARPTADQWKSIQQDPSQPLFPRSTQMALPPGGLFKIVTAISALESQAVTADEILHCRGYLDSPDQYRCLLFRQHGIGHGQLTIEDALSQSCHVCFHEMARRLNSAPLLDWGRRLGFGAATGIDLPRESTGRLPNTAIPANSNRISGETLQLGVGQGALLVTPLQVARLLASVANGGYLVTPHVTQSISTNNSVGENSLVKIPGLTPETLISIRQGLESSVESPRGACHAARIELVRMGAICGTGTVSGKPDHAWVAGYAPAENPRMVIVLVLEHGGAGENGLAVFREFVTELLGFGELRPFQRDPRQASPVE